MPLRMIQLLLLWPHCNPYHVWKKYCIITPSNIDIKTIDDFCIGKIKIAQNRKYIPPTSGGMGLINLHDFIIGIQSSWIKRVYQHGADNWRFDLLQKTHGNPFLLNSTLVSRNDVHLTAFICVKSCQRIERSLKNIRAVKIIRIKCKKVYVGEKIPEVCMLGKK